jgi:hypothetical protein
VERGFMTIYEEQYPKHLGPPPIPNGKAGKLHDSTKPTYLLQLDQGAFMAVWEHMEAEARHRFPTRETYAFARAYLRAVQAMRDCYWSNHEAPEKPPRKLVRGPKRSG